jgi:hypothetical protein
MIELVCRDCGRCETFPDGTTYKGTPIDRWFAWERQRYCKECFEKHFAHVESLARMESLVHSEDGGSLTEQFIRFHRANPWVYDALVTLARDLVHRGHRRVGIGMLFEVLRWQYQMRTVGDDFKLNNNFRSRYARLIMGSEPDLADVFETRELRSA